MAARERKQAYVINRLTHVLPPCDDRRVWACVSTDGVTAARKIARTRGRGNAHFALLPLGRVYRRSAGPARFPHSRRGWATRLGFWPACAAAVAGTGTADFYFTQPDHSFWIADPKEVIELLAFLLVAGHQQQPRRRLKRERDVSHAREQEMRGLYQFSRNWPRLHSGGSHFRGSGLSDQHAAPTHDLGPPADHGPAPRRCRVAQGSVRSGDCHDGFRRAATACAGRRRNQQSLAVAGRIIRHCNLRGHRCRSGSADGDSASVLEQQVETVLAEAIGRLRQLDVGHAFSEARLRTQWTFCDRHWWETSRTSCAARWRRSWAQLGVLIVSQQIKQSEHTRALVETVLQAARRLDEDIRRLLDATRITAGGVCPQRDWVDPVDLIDRALAQKEARLGSHRLAVDNSARAAACVAVTPRSSSKRSVRCSENAAKYSPHDLLITVNGPVRA